MKSRVHPTHKTKYHVQNLAFYDRALVHLSCVEDDALGEPLEPDLAVVAPGAS